ncbi:hypothetical protein MXAN_5067 [Myxococcus xanthus DK 1622]|uniref:Uncharacterized protein n=1 Tax=Myxococcus xanthus (strain DK1622) TaxID=246197 RepID=Q1D2A2_MYXXD|nr:MULTISPECIES: hypothetical protein [Myxococcus]ABF86698.1 hypothetical protein MXAN_5067 [Myxococcus xanthus DK 1622]NOJ54423.1 hypothetical protein [Myxococcus xanthus]QPM77579.1 hypothetical protein I5Q59_25065 [Myxococcus xanthus]QVW66645.1 hypothetical protein JTM82_30415 [Myxococcus xanthus DZ2]QZZ52733.1 hypothetical protein MyxoNM_26330 [Myxococcus xanthus]
MDRLSQLLWLWMLFFAVNALWALAQTAVASTLGARPVSVVLGYGPTLLSARLGSILWAFRPLALGSAVSFDEPVEGAPAKSRLLQLSPPLHAAVILLPWAVQVAIAMACLGSTEALRQFVSGFAVPFEPSLLPGRVERFLALLRDGDLLRAWGLMSAKLAALNLLPLPALAGGTFLLLPWRKGYPVWAGLLGILGLLAAVPWVLYVLYVVIKALV